MTRFVFLCGLVLASVCLTGAQSNPALRDELLQMRDRDQAVREKCANGTAEQQGKCLIDSADEADRPNTKRINEIFNKSGFPVVSQVGSDGVKAYVLIMQHSGDIELRNKSRKGMKRAFKDKVLSANEYTNFVDRLLVDQGRRQIYGANFTSRDGKLVMSPVKDPKNLDKRRKAIGLPPIAEYAKILSEAYKLEVVIPPGN